MKRPNFDAYNTQPMTVCGFIRSDGSVCTLQGRCRGFGGISGTEQESEVTVGIYEPDGTYHNILIDLRVRCALPTFRIGDKNFHFPIVECQTMGMRVDGETGRGIRPGV